VLGHEYEGRYEAALASLQEKLTVQYFCYMFGTLLGAGVPILRPPVSDVEAQIDRVIGLLRGHRLFIGRGLTGLLNELTTYSRELDAHGQPTERIANKAAYHRLDALRYVVAGLTRGQQRARVWEY